MKLTIEIDCSNDVFADGNLTNEIRNIVHFALSDLNDSIGEVCEGSKFSIEMGLLDSNGNYVGTLTYK